MKFIEALNILMSLIAISSPYVAVPVMISLTRGQSLAEKRRVAKVASLALAVILITFSWIGPSLFALFGIHLAALQLGGGFVVFLFGLSALQSKNEKAAKPGESIGIVPLATPLMAGPGAISQVIIAAEEFPGILSRIQITLTVLVLSAIVWACLFFSTFLERILGITGLNVMGNLGGLVLVAIAVETMMKGLIGFFSALGL